MSRIRAGSTQALLLTGLLGVTGCLTNAGVGPNARTPLPVVESVDLERFAGLWYVIESMPTSAESGAHDATEYYALREDGGIDIVFSFREDAFDGPEKVLEMRGWVLDESGAEWRVRPFWPLRLAYLVIDLAPDYRYAVVGHPSKRYVWVMSRTPTLDPITRRAIRRRLADAGYDVRRIREVPQQGRPDRRTGLE